MAKKSGDGLISVKLSQPNAGGAVSMMGNAGFFGGLPAQATQPTSKSGTTTYATYRNPQAAHVTPPKVMDVYHPDEPLFAILRDKHGNERWVRVMTIVTMEDGTVEYRPLPSAGVHSSSGGHCGECITLHPDFHDMRSGMGVTSHPVLTEGMIY